MDNLWLDMVSWWDFFLILFPTRKCCYFYACCKLLLNSQWSHVAMIMCEITPVLISVNISIKAKTSRNRWWICLNNKHSRKRESKIPFVVYAIHAFQIIVERYWRLELEFRTFIICNGVSLHGMWSWIISIALETFQILVKYYLSAGISMSYLTR